MLCFQLSMFCKTVTTLCAKKRPPFFQITLSQINDFSMLNPEKI